MRFVAISKPTCLDNRALAYLLQLINKGDGRQNISITETLPYTIAMLFSETSLTER